MVQPKNHTKPSPMRVLPGEDNSDRWANFKESWEDLCLLEEVYAKEPKLQVAAFRVAFGEANRQLLRNLGLGAIRAADVMDPRKSEACGSLRDIIDMLDKRFEKHENVIHRRYIFTKTTQGSGETVSDFYDRLLRLSKSCSYNSAASVMIRDQLVVGTNDSKAREAIFRETKDLTCDDVVATLKLFEQNTAVMQEIEANKPVTAESANAARHSENRRKPAFQAQRRPQTSNRRFERRASNLCDYCGEKHAPRSCRAFGHTCSKCSRRNHFEAMCRSSENAKQITVEEEYDSEWDDDVRMVSAGETRPKKKYYITVELKHKESLRVQLDCGATISCMSLDTYNRLNLRKTVERLDTTETLRVKGFDDSSSRSVGTCVVKCRFAGRRYDLRFAVFDKVAETLLAGYQAESLGVIKFSKDVERVHQVTTTNGVSSNDYQSLINEFADIFEGLGCFPQPVKIEIDTTIIPRQQAPRKTPISTKDALIKKIKELEAEGIIEPVRSPTPWISNLVQVPKKDGSLRITLDPSFLNKAIIRPRYPMPTLEEHLPLLAGAKLFSTVDAKDGFYQMKLHPDSADLTTFWTPTGRYRYRRVPQGISSAPEEYQRRQIQAYEGLRGVLVVADDALVFGVGNTDEEARRDHDRNLRQLFERVREVGIRLNRKKLQIGKKLVQYMGHVISCDGVGPDPEKVRAIADMPAPTDSKGVARFLGMANYLLQFVPSFADTAAPLREVGKSSHEFMWESSQQNAFDAIKRLLTQAPVLSFFDSKKEAIIYTDASDLGVGACLIQEGRPVAYHSHTLSPTEQRYAVIEKECLAIVSACLKFDHLLFGKPRIRVLSDHKPLSTIFQKPLENCPRRLQRMRLTLQRYDLVVEYIAGSKNVVADALSRAPTATPQTNTPNKEAALRLEYETMKTRTLSRVSDALLTRIASCTESDHEGRMLRDAIQNNRWTAHPLLEPYRPIRENLFIEDDLIFHEQACYIPPPLRGEMLKRCHRSHLARDAMLRRARGAIFWPGLTKDIEILVDGCQACQLYSTKQRREPLINGEIPRYPFEIVHQDLMEWEGQWYLVTVDGYSDFFDLSRLGRTTTTHRIVEVTKRIFATFGSPTLLRTDSDPRYLSKEFQTFCADWEISHRPSAPHHHSANGKAESGVKIAKRILKKCSSQNEDLQAALLEWRNTPDKDGLTPAEKCLSRRPRTLLPSRQSARQPRVPENVTANIERRRTKQKQQHDKGARALKPLAQGDEVRIEPLPHQKTWSKGKIRRKLESRRFLVETENGTLLERNRRFLKPAHQDSTKEKAVINEPAIPTDGPVWDGPGGPAVSRMTRIFAARNRKAPAEETPAKPVLDAANETQIAASEGHPSNMPREEESPERPGEAPREQEGSEASRTRSGRIVLRPSRFVPG